MLDGAIQYWPTFCDSQEARRWFEELRDVTPWQQPEITVYGRTCPVPRLTAWYGDAGASYQYSGIAHQPLPWTPLLVTIKSRLEDQLGQSFNSVLLNLYRDGADGNGWHADDEPELSPAHGIASLSLGAERRFRLRDKAPPRQSRGYLDLQSGALLYMLPGAQQRLQHCITKTRRAVAPRINLTFRWLTH